MKVIREFSVEESQADSAIAKRVQSQRDSTTVVVEAPRTEDYRLGKTKLHVTARRGKAFDLCASESSEYRCCNMHVLRALSNCPYDCSYCFLQNYLTDATTWVVGDNEALIDEVRQAMVAQPWRFLRIGTWELGDSLALEGITGAASDLVRAFADLPSAVLELRTKGCVVEPLLGLPHGGRTIVGWTLNPEVVVRREEMRTASIAERITAMRRVVDAGYPVSLHFDPMILHDGWEESYDELVDAIFAVIPPERVAWISVGSMRFNPEMKKTLEENYPKSRVTSTEMVLGNDGKIRYVKPMRRAMYSHLVRAIHRNCGQDIFAYLCMERWDVWQRVFGRSPDSTGHVDFLMTKSLFERFPGLVATPPNRSDYEQAAAANAC